MVDQGVVAIISRLADSYQEINYTCCARALCNLACADEGNNTSSHSHHIWVLTNHQNILPPTPTLSDNPSHLKHLLSPRINHVLLPHLPIQRTARLRVATEGGFEALMMISMVRSVDLQTKLLCVIALCNLLDDCTVEYILNEGLVGSVANLSKISDSDTTHLCATLMNQLTYYLPARLNIAEKVPIVVVEYLSIRLSMHSRLFPF